MSFLRFREKQIVVGAVLLAALVAISSGIVHFGNSLAHKSVPEHPFAWAELASRFQGRRIGVMCSSTVSGSAGMTKAFSTATVSLFLSEEAR